MNITTLAERATLGALMTTPDSAAAMNWLRPSDFFDPWHEQVHRCIKELAVAGELVNPELVGRALLDRLGPTRANVVQLTELIRATPAHPESATYGAMVLEAAIRRETAAQGVLLRAGALAAALDWTPRPLLAVAAMITTTFDANESRWRSAIPGPHTLLDSPADPVRPSEPTRMDPGWTREHGRSADKLLRRHPAIDPAATAEREADLIASLIARPREIGSVRGWLRPDTLTNQAWRPVYRSLLALADRGRPIDAITVLWETERTSSPEAPTREVKPVVARVEVAYASNPGYLARQVAADHLRLGADHAALQLYAAAENPNLGIWQVMSTARTQLAQVCDAAQPLTIATPARREPAVTQLRPTLIRNDRLQGPVAG